MEAGSNFFFEIVLCWNSSCILGKIKLDWLVHLILKYLLAYMIIDHIALTATRKVNFLLFEFAFLMMIVLCLENCSFYTLGWYEQVLVSISVFWGDLGMTSEGNFNVYLCPWKVFLLKSCWGTSFPTLLSAFGFPFQFNSC